MPRITKAEFLTSFAAYRDGAVSPMPEIAIVGRSNVGKSSLLNMLCNRNKLAKVSATPGKTRLINYFKIDDRFYLVDLPGYGFAKASKEEQKRWASMIEGYLKRSECLVAALLLVDIRHKPTQDDIMMADWFRAYGIPFYVIATKADKLSKAQQKKSLMDIGFYLRLDMLKDIRVTSAEKKQGAEEVTELLFSLVDEALASDEPESEQTETDETPTQRED